MYSPFLPSSDTVSKVCGHSHSVFLFNSLILSFNFHLEDLRPVITLFHPQAPAFATDFPPDPLLQISGVTARTSIFNITSQTASPCLVTKTALGFSPAFLSANLKTRYTAITRISEPMPSSALSSESVSLQMLSWASNTGPGPT